MWTTKIVQVDYDPVPDQLVGFGVDTPKKNDVFDDNSFFVSGWLLGDAQPVDYVHFTLNNVTRRAAIKTAHADIAQLHPQHPHARQSGFRHQIPFELTSGNATLTISVKIGTGMVRLGRIFLQTEFSGISLQPAYEPIMVTSLGRTGTTLSLNALGNHPEIAVARVHPFETNVAQELMQNLLDCLPLRKTSNLPTSLRCNFEDAYQEKTIRHFIESIDQYYEAIARSNKQNHARFFAEKFLPSRLQNWFNELYPRTKEIFLVRDFRDVICSILSFNKKRGFDDFQRQNFGSDLDYIRNFGGPNALLNQWKTRNESALLVRYEDLILDAQRTWVRIFEYLEVDASPKIINRISAVSEKPSKVVKRHSTSGSRRESVGRWRRDLPPQLIDAAQEAFEDALTGFGYQL